MDMEFDIQCLQYMALESTIACDPEDYGLPDEKKYPMPDKKHVLLAIKFFNSTEDPEKQKILAANINKRIKDFNMESEVNVGDKNRFKKYWKPATESANDTILNVLYHGSNNLTKVIKPHVSTHGTSEVYATADKKFALCYSGKQWNDFIISQAYYNGELMLTEIEEGAFDKVFNCSGYLYTVNKDNFTKLNSREYVCHTQVPVISTTKIDNVLSELKRLKVKMYRYPDLPPFIKSRKEYIKKKEEFFNGDKQSLKDEISKSYNGNEAVITAVSPIVPYTKPALKKAESVDDPLLMRFPIKKKKVPAVESTSQQSSIIQSKNKYLIKDENGKKISELGCYDYSKKDFNWILFADIETDKAHRNEGLGSKLLNRAYSDVIKDNPKNGVYLMVRPDNKVAISFYKKNGFEFVKSVKLNDGNYDLMCKGNADKSQLINMNYS